MILVDIIYVLDLSLTLGEKKGRKPGRVQVDWEKI
jgi:hypothetical protein